MNRMTKILLVFSAVIPVWAGGLRAGDYQMITDLGSSARTIAIGNIEGFSYSPSEIFGNPAGISSRTGSSLALFSATLMNEFTFNSVGMTTQTPFGTIGVGFMQASILNVPFTGKRDASQNLNEPFYTISEFDYKNTVSKLVYQKQFPDQRLSLGAAATRYATAFHDVSGSGYNVDIGAILDLEKISFSMAIKNVFPFHMNYNSGVSEKLPFQWISGVTYGFFDTDLLFQLKNSGGQNLISAGLVYAPGFARYFQILAGYKESMVPGVAKPKTSGTLGLGLKLNSLQVYYAYEKSDHFEFDSTHYFSTVLDI